MNILVNSVIEWFYEDIDDRSPIFEKVLWIEPASISDSTHKTVVVINLSDEKAIPFTRTIREITDAADIGLVRLLESDPYAIKLIQEEDIEPRHRKRRDHRYSIISEIIELEGVHGYLPKDRGRIIRRAVSEGVSSRKSIYHLLRLWWKGGQNRNALLPRFDNCGNPGKRRTGSSSSDKKLGKPSNASKSSGERIGVRITARDEIKFAKGTRRFYEGRKKKSLVKAHRQILFAYYNIGYEKKDGVLVPILPPAAQLPTLDQFRYWYNSVFCDPVRRVKKRRGETRFNLQYRAITGDATSIAFGPGSVYQIDATIADVYLVSHYFGLKIIGRPVIYVVIDVFSRMIVGVAVLMEGPSWYGAMLALDNVLEDKVEYCKRFGITIEECDWPVREFPAVIMADRGELKVTTLKI
jgi:transposase InsO family protein